MEENEEVEDSPSTPFWLQSSTNHRRNRRHVLSSFFLSSGLLIFLLCLTAVVFIFFVIPSIVSLTSQIFTPTNVVKKSWDSVNVVLVLVALVFGFLSRNRPHDYDENHRSVSSEVTRNEIRKSSNPSTPRQQWYEYSDRTVYGGSSAVNGGGLRRNSSSYPDLRDVSPWVNADDRWRFSDDIQVEAHRYSDSDRLRRRLSWKRVDEEEEEEQEAVLATLAKEDSNAPPPPSSQPPPPPSPPALQPTALQRKPKRTYESIEHKEQVKGSEPTKTLTPPPVTPQPPPSSIDSEKKSSKSDRKRSGANATKDLFTSIYNQRNKKKKRRQKSVENFETLIQPQPPSPPPPPPPPPPSVFHNLLSSKKGNSKKIITIPPPGTTASALKTTALILSKTGNFQRVQDNSHSGGESLLTGSESPLIPIPPPPPPPFKMPSWRFVVKGDYVKVGSMDSSRSGSPDDSPTSTPTAADGGEAVAQLFCPSPDVDTKADMFIAKFRAGLKLQKMNSMIRQSQGLGLSNLGPDTKPGQGPSQI